MARKKTEVTTSAKTIDYLRIIDDMNDDAFSFCVSNLYPVLNYRVLQETDIRRIDLKESLLKLEENIPNTYKKKGLLSYYLTEMKAYFDNMLICLPDSRAQRYKTRAIETMELALGEDGTIEDVDDIFYCFMILLHAAYSHADETKKPLEAPSSGIYLNDAEILKKLSEQKGYNLSGSDAKKGFIDKFTIEIDKSESRRFMYINNILFLCRALQNLTGFVKEEEECQI